MSTPTVQQLVEKLKLLPHPGVMLLSLFAETPDRKNAVLVVRRVLNCCAIPLAEGGFFAETFRDAGGIAVSALPPGCAKPAADRSAVPRC